MNEPDVDRKVVQCNYAETTKVAAKGARAYVTLTNPGGGNDRIMVLVRSHGGRWVEKWESVKRLCDFRIKVMPPEHPLYGRELLSADDADRLFADVAREGVSHQAAAEAKEET